VAGRPIESLLITVEAKPEIIKMGDYDYLVLPAVEGREIEIAYSPEKAWCKAMPRDRKLKFTIWQTKLVSSHEVETTDWECKGVLSQTERILEHSSWFSEIETIHDGDGLLYDARICPLHKKKMERGELDISYGLPRGEFVEFVRKTPFPGFVLGGCCRGPIDKTIGYRCPECVRSYKNWEEEEIERERSKKPGERQPK
jgi:hypothetical protein